MLLFQSNLLPMWNKKRTYLDYNATSPLDLKVSEAIANGEWGFGNPSSVHATGKAAKRQVNEVRSYLFNLFGLKDEEFKVFFHSGATEGINSIVKGMALTALSNKEKFLFVHTSTDHSCVRNQKEFLNLIGIEVLEAKVHHDGALDWASVDEIINSNKDKKVLFNWTWVNNETGVVFPLEDAIKLKEKSGWYIHVDSVQAPGKISNWSSLKSELDAYTFSGHKFGALKGTGLTFIKNKMKILPILDGGGQQGGNRSGTENSWGIFSLKLALSSLVENYNFTEQNSAKEYLENGLMEVIGEKGFLVAGDNPQRNGNTSYIVLKGIKAHTSAMAFDMAGFDLSNGSACSSGAVVPSVVLLAMGYSCDDAKSALRFSYSSQLTKKEAIELLPSLSEIFKRLLT